MQITQANTKSIAAEVKGFSGNTLTVDLVLWMARELQAAVDAGMPKATEVKVEGNRMSARCTLVDPIEPKHNHDIDDTDCSPGCPVYDARPK